MKPLIIAHRGASGYLPEHTLAAKTLAHEMGADYLEQDIVASRDNELVVLHDIHLDRVTNVADKFAGRERADGRFYVRDFDWQELRSLAVWERMNADGSRVYPGRYAARSGDFRLNTLAEEIELIQTLNDKTGREAGIYPEIKRPEWHRQDGVDIAPLLLKVLDDFGYKDREDAVFVQCFDDTEIHRLRHELECQLKLVQLIGDYDALGGDEGIAKIAATADGIGPHLSHLYALEQIDFVPVATGLHRLAHDHGLVVHPYTFRADDLPAGFASFEELIRYFAVDIGVDGLFTDFPDLALRHLAQ